LVADSSGAVGAFTVKLPEFEVKSCQLLGIVDLSSTPAFSSRAANAFGSLSRANELRLSVIALTGEQGVTNKLLPNIVDVASKLVTVRNWVHITPPRFDGCDRE
jgi:hypothetical protein